MCGDIWWINLTTIIRHFRIFHEKFIPVLRSVYDKMSKQLDRIKDFQMLGGLVLSS